MPSKLSDAEIAEIRSLSAHGARRAEIAARFGISVQHVGRLLRGNARPTIANPDARLVKGGNVTKAVENFLKGLELDAGRRVLAETAIALATKLDQCRESAAAAAAQAAPSVARQLVEVIGSLRDGGPLPDDPLTRIRQ